MLPYLPLDGTTPPPFTVKRLILASQRLYLATTPSYQAHLLNLASLALWKNHKRSLLYCAVCCVAPINLYLLIPFSGFGFCGITTYYWPPCYAEYSGVFCDVVYFLILPSRNCRRGGEMLPRHVGLEKKFSNGSSSQRWVQ